MPIEPMEAPERATTPPPKTYQTTAKGLRIASKLRSRSLLERFDNSPIMNAVSIKQLSDDCPRNFVGRCTYFDLGDDRNHGHLHGEYRIVHTYSRQGVRRHKGVPYNENAECFTPSSQRSIIIKTDVSQTESGTAMNAAFGNERWAGVEIVFNGETMCVGLELPHVSHHIVDGAPAALIQPPTPNGDRCESESKTRLDKVLEMGINGSGDNSVSFGMKHMLQYTDYDDYGQAKTVHLGFEFLQLELDCVDPVYGSQDNQVITAVKLSNDAPDVGSQFLLMQQIQLPSNRAYYELREQWDDTYRQYY